MWTYYVQRTFYKMTSGSIYGLIYEIVNTCNGKGYCGQTTVSHIDRWQGHFYDSRYSDRLICKAIRKYGEQSFISKVIDFACSQKELDEKEIKYIALRKYYPPELGFGYNMTPGGSTFIPGVSSPPELLYEIPKVKIKRIISSEDRELTRLARSKPKNQDHKDRISATLKGRPRSASSIQQQKETRKKNCKPSPLKGKQGKLKGRPKSNQHKLALSQSNLGSFKINNGISEQILRAGKSIPDGWTKGTLQRQSQEARAHLREINLGKICPEEVKKKISAKLLGRPSCNKGTVWITNGIASKMVPKNTTLADGWKYGRIIKIAI